MSSYSSYEITEAVFLNCCINYIRKERILITRFWNLVFKKFTQVTCSNTSTLTKMSTQSFATGVLFNGISKALCFFFFGEGNEYTSFCSSYHHPANWRLVFFFKSVCFLFFRFLNPQLS